MKLFTAPQKVVKYEELLEGDSPMLFLAGSIEQGTAVDWQTKVIKALDDEDVIILNPRRENWDASWEQSIDNKQFKEQVLWELDGIDKSDIILIYFDPKTKAPISLLEYGLVCDNPDKTVLIYCPKGFYRKGNVDIVAEKYNIDVFEDEDKMMEKLITLINI